MKQKKNQAKWLGKRKWSTARDCKLECYMILSYAMLCHITLRYVTLCYSLCLCSTLNHLLNSFLFLFSLFSRLDEKLKDISRIAAEITQNVSLQQGKERKKVIEHIRGLYKIDLSASRHWQELVQQLTHDRWALYRVLCISSSKINSWLWLKLIININAKGLQICSTILAALSSYANGDILCLFYYFISKNILLKYKTEYKISRFAA